MEGWAGPPSWLGVLWAKAPLIKARGLAHPCF